MIDNILTYLDIKIETFLKKKGDYPKLLCMNELTKNKIFSELNLCSPSIEGCWIDNEDNYRGITIKMTSIEGINLE